MIISTKCWEGDWRVTLERIKYSPPYHYGKQLWLVVNNMRTDISEEAMACGVTRFINAEAFVDAAEKFYNVHFEPETRGYSISELVELYLADQPLIHYASDVIPPKDDWTKDAKKYLKKYRVVMADWDSEGVKREEETDFGFTTIGFSDQCYAINPETFKPDFNVNHLIGEQYPEHGGEDFEKRVGMWLADTGQKTAVLSNYRFRHIDRRDK